MYKRLKVFVKVLTFYHYSWLVWWLSIWKTVPSLVKLPWKCISMSLTALSSSQNPALHVSHRDKAFWQHKPILWICCCLSFFYFPILLNEVDRYQEMILLHRLQLTPSTIKLVEYVFIQKVNWMYLLHSCLIRRIFNSQSYKTWAAFQIIISKYFRRKVGRCLQCRITPMCEEFWHNDVTNLFRIEGGWYIKWSVHWTIS